MDRRTFIKGAVIAASTPGVVASGVSVDPLLDTINAYRAGLVDFNQNAPEDDEGADAYAETSYGPPFDALINWTAPATTRDGAMAALRLVVDEGEHRHSELNYPLISAALAYFEKEATL